MLFARDALWREHGIFPGNPVTVHGVVRLEGGDLVHAALRPAPVMHKPHFPPPYRSAAPTGWGGRAMGPKFFGPVREYNYPLLSPRSSSFLRMSTKKGGEEGGGRGPEEGLVQILHAISACRWVKR